jgi:ribonucleotide reductase alpha subunit
MSALPPSITEIPLQSASLDIWKTKYRLITKNGEAVDKDIEATYQRVAKALAAVEITPELREKYYQEFLWALNQGAIPAGRIISNAGAEKHKPATSTINCTVSGVIEDSMDDILDKVHEAGLTLKAGCGTGYCFSTLRPKDAYVSGAGAYTSGPLSFMDIYDKMCFTVSSAGGRRGAQMATFDICHPDVVEFIRAKREDGRLRQFNLSLLITSEFIEAVKNKTDWPLSFPVTEKEVKEDNLDLKNTKQIIWRELPNIDQYVNNKAGLVACRIIKTIPAQRLWDIIMSSTYDYAEPGFILIDKVNEMNNNWYCENIRATNPCLAEGTLVLTPTGLRKIETIKEGDIISTIDGKGAIKTVEKHEKLAVLCVEFANGVRLRATKAHIFHTLDCNKKIDKNKRLHQLKIGDLVCTYNKGELSTIAIIKIEADGFANVYDLYEPTSDTWITEGIVNRGCGEQALPAYGSCLLGSINLTRFIDKPFTKAAQFDWDLYRKTIRIFTRMLDNVVEINGLPLEKQREEIISKRRHGMGYLGLGSTVTMLGMKYGDEQSLQFTDKITKILAIEGWKEGLALAKEKGTAPILEQLFVVTGEMLHKRPEMVSDGYKVGDEIAGKVLHAKYSRYMQLLAKEEPELIAELIEVGARFTHATSIAPTGTLSLSLANNTSNGIEPSFAHHYSRNVIRQGKKSKEKIDVYSFELLAYRALINSKAMPYSEDPAQQLPDCFISADDVTPKQHVDVQAAAQKWIDSSISKTANVPTDYPYEDFKDIYQYAYEKGLKGCFDIDSPNNIIVLANGCKVNFRELFDLGIGTKIRINNYEIAEVVNLYRNGNQQTCRYTFSDGTKLDCTPDHKLDSGEKIHDAYLNKTLIEKINNTNYAVGLPDLSELDSDEFIIPAISNGSRYSVSNKGYLWRHLFGESKNNKNKWLKSTVGEKYNQVKYTNSLGVKSSDYIHKVILSYSVPNKNIALDSHNHKDGNKKNNAFTNLERCSGKFNLAHRGINELQKKASTGYFGVYQVTPTCFRYSFVTDTKTYGASKYTTALLAAKARETLILAEGFNLDPYYTILNFSDNETEKTESVFNTNLNTKVKIVACESLGVKEVVDIEVKTSEHVYMVSGIRVHNCTTFRFNPEVFQGVLVKESDLENTTYQFTLEDGSSVELKGNEEVEYDGEMHSAANLFDALKEGYYGKF